MPECLGSSAKRVGGLDPWIQHRADPSASLGMTASLKAVIPILAKTQYLFVMNI
jgi:hypothetical protein